MPKRATRSKKRKKKAVNYVRGETNTLELANVGSAINLEVYRDGMLGRLLVGLGGLAWIPAGKRKSQKKQIPWEVFSVLMDEWPFGNSKEARLKFIDGALTWRSPGKKGRGRKITWDEFEYLMELWFTKLKRQRRRRQGSEESRPPQPPGVTPPGPGGSAQPIRIDGIRQAMVEIHKVFFETPGGDAVWLVHSGSKKQPKPIDVLINDVRQGWIDVDGCYHPTSGDAKARQTAAVDLREFLGNRDHWVLETGRRHGICAVCGRRLTHPVSVALGIGPVCAGRLGIDYAPPPELQRGVEVVPEPPTDTGSEEVPPAPGLEPIEIDGIREAMLGIKKVFFKASDRDGLWLVHTGPEKDPAPIQVLINDSLKGWIDTEGFYHPGSPNRSETRRVVADLRKFVEDPEHWVLLTGRKHKICAICGHPIKTEVSRLRGVGPVCAKKLRRVPPDELLGRVA